MNYFSKGDSDDVPFDKDCLQSSDISSDSSFDDLSDNYAAGQSEGVDYNEVQHIEMEESRSNAMEKKY